LKKKLEKKVGEKKRQYAFSFLKPEKFSEAREQLETSLLKLI